jgi:hypothetical protein
VDDDDIMMIIPVLSRSPSASVPGPSPTRLQVLASGWSERAVGGRTRTVRCRYLSFACGIKFFAVYEQRRERMRDLISWSSKVSGKGPTTGYEVG